MKKLFLLMLSGFCMNLSSSFTSAAQESKTSFTSMQPLWGPTGYNVAFYYYLPDIEAYYDIPEKRFIYWENGERISSATLPEEFKTFDLYSAYKVVLIVRTRTLI